jgi:glutamate/tyrosine decarboxylase-like PLP-dependent enzyme
VIERIRELEKVARQLEPAGEQRSRLITAVVEYAERFLDRLDVDPAYAPAGDGRGLFESPIGETGMPIEEALRLIGEHVDTPGINPASGRHFGYIPGGGIFHSALGDYLADVTNRYSGVFFASPGAVRMENLLLRWMAGLVGYPAGSGGNLTSGGSLANLIGVVCARDAHGVEAAQVPQAVVYTTEQAHHSVHKALRIAGLGRAVMRLVAVDPSYRMKATSLDALVHADRQAGLLPWLVVAAAGTTNTGSVDPLDAIAGVAAHHGLWLHVDGAYGAFFALCDEGRHILQGIERSDSLVMDPHKTLFLPYGSGALLVRDNQHLLRSHYYLADYMQDAATAQEEPSPADYSPELTKHFRGLRLWLPLKLLGVAPFRAALEEKLLLARYFHQRLSQVPGFEVGPSPDLSVVTYRYLPRRGDADDFNRRLVQAVQQDGRVFVSSTMVHGRFVLRLAIVVFRSHLAEVDQAIEILTETARRLERES